MAQPLPARFCAILGVSLSILLLALNAQAQDEGGKTEKVKPTAPAKPEVKDLGNGNYELKGIRFSSETREVHFPAEVNLHEELLEYAIVHDMGATHEALLRTKVRPFDLQVVLHLLRYAPFKEGLFDGFDRDAASQEAPTISPDDVPQNARAEILLRWTVDGEEKEARLESWIKDIKTGTPMRNGFWQFNGLPDPATMKHWKPEAESNLVGIYLSEFAPINYPYEGNRTDEAWVPNASKMPPLDSKVDVILRPLTKSK